MSNNQEQFHPTDPNYHQETFPDGFKMRWDTNDKSTRKKRGSAHSPSHSGRGSKDAHSHSRSRKGNRESGSVVTPGKAPELEDLIFQEKNTSSKDSRVKPNLDMTSGKNPAKEAKWEESDSGKSGEEIQAQREMKSVSPEASAMIKPDPMDWPREETPVAAETVGPEKSETELSVEADETDPSPLITEDLSANATEPRESEREREPEGAEFSEPVPGNMETRTDERGGYSGSDSLLVRGSDSGKKAFLGRKPEKRKPVGSERRPWSGKKKTGIAVLCAFLALILGGLAFVNGFMNKIGRENSDILPKADPDKEYEDIDSRDRFGVGEIDLNPIRQDTVKNILLIGQDRRKGDGARMRSDSMIVATIDLTTNEIKLTSLMRDMYIPVPGYGYGMINATYLNGGMALLDATIEENFGITIDGNVEVDFDRFVKLMDLVGPIEIELNKEEVEYLNRGNGWNLKVGTNTMTSEQVLAYARTRYVGRSDWERTDRQRRVLTKIFNKLRGSDLPTLYHFANEAFPLFKTDLTNREILKYVYTVISNKMTITQSKRIPVDGTYTQEVKEETLSVLVPKLASNAQALQKFVYGYSNVEVEENEKKEAAKTNTSEKKNTTDKEKSPSSLVIDE